ncbi:MAG TPA: CpsD/CapB family tyrosine-protein kinase [Microthrixaceae bacterium]|nr:CpsD/CapB family tyrosine-protein kinase [Microthrixaceae bacterium]
MTKLRAVLKRRWPVLVAAVVLGVLAGVLSSAVASREVVVPYEARQVLVATSNGNSANVTQDALRVTRGPVVEAAAKSLGLPSAEMLAGKVGAKPDEVSRSIVVSSQDVDAAAASRRVGAVVDAFLVVVNGELTQGDRKQLEDLQQQVDQAQAELAEFDAQNPAISSGQVAPDDLAAAALVAKRGDLVDRVQSADENLASQKASVDQRMPYSTLGVEAPTKVEGSLVSVPRSSIFRIFLLGFLGLMLGIALVFGLERVSRRIDTRDELVDVVDLPILAEIGFLKEAKRAHDADGVLKLEGVWAEPYRRVRSAIQFVQATRGSGLNGSTGSDSPDGVPPPRVFMITSTAPGEGKSTTAALTGHALAEVGEPTVVIGGDFRRPEVDRLMGVPRQPSILDMAQMSLDRPTVDDVVHQTRFPSLYAAPAGKGTREVAGSIEAAKEVAREAVARGATVVFDSSPLQAANDTIDLLPVVDYVILVVRSGRSTEASLRDVVDTLRRMDAKILGVVLIGSPVAGRQQTYYYDYYSPTDPVDGPPQSSGFSNLGSSRGSAPHEEGIEEVDGERDPVSVRSAQPPTAPTAWSGTASPSPWSSPPPGPRTQPPSVPPPWSSHPPDQPAPG